MGIRHDWGCNLSANSCLQLLSPLILGNHDKHKDIIIISWKHFVYFTHRNSFTWWLNCLSDFIPSSMLCTEGSLVQISLQQVRIILLFLGHWSRLIGLSPWSPAVMSYDHLYSVVIQIKYMSYVRYVFWSSVEWSSLGLWIYSNRSKLDVGMTISWGDFLQVWPSRND